MKKQLSAALVTLLISLTAIAQHRTGGFDDGTYGSGMSFGIQPAKNKSLLPEEKKLISSYEDDLFRVEMHLRANWKKCVNKYADMPSNILDAHQQMTLLFDPKSDGSDCPSENQVRLSCLLEDKKIFEKIKNISHSKVAKKLDVIDLSTKETYENLQEMTKQLVRMKK